MSPLVFGICWNLEEAGIVHLSLSSRIDELSSGKKGKQAGKKQILPSSMSFHVGCHQTVWSMFRLSMTTSNYLSKKISTQIRVLARNFDPSTWETGRIPGEN